MSEKLENADKNFNRKANSLNAVGVRTANVNKIQALYDAAADNLLTRSGSVTSPATGGSPRVPLMYVDPMFDPILLMFPKDNLKELNRRLRHYYTFHPIVRNLIDLHSTFPFSDVEFRCEEKSLEPYWEDFSRRIGALEMMTHMQHDRELLGESFHIGNWSDEDSEWKSFNQYPPESLEVYRTYVGEGIAYFLKPDEDLKRKATSSQKADRVIFDQLDPDLKAHIISGRPYHIDTNRVIHYSNKPVGYIPRGEPTTKAALKYLMMEDRLYMLLTSFIDNLMFPIKIWKVGSKEKNWLPTRKHLDMLQQKIAEMKGDPNYDLIYHAFLELDIKSPSQGKDDLIKYFEWTQKRILISLFATESMFAESNPYAKDAVSVKLVMHRYMKQRTNVNNAFMEKVYSPIAIKRRYEIRSNSERKDNVREDYAEVPDFKRYYLPRLFWRPANLISGMAEQEFLNRLREKGDLPADVIYDVLGIDKDKVTRSLGQEQGTVLDPIYREARKTSIKDDSLRQQVLQGKPTKEWEFSPAAAQPAPAAKPAAGAPPGAPEDMPAAGAIPPAGAVPPAAAKGPGRPAKPEDERFKRDKALIPPDVMSAREKQQEKDILPKPAGEEAPPL